MEFETIIGLEIHVELNTKTKIFCSCINKFGGKPNTNCCPICTGMPGTLPTLNQQVVEHAIKVGLSLNCEIVKHSKFDRKNYFYPDLPKAYQISQSDLPLCANGYLYFYFNNEIKRIRINRIHIEEDAGKLIHSENSNVSFVDFNRCGVPLIEIVTEPDFRSCDEVKAFLQTLKSILLYLNVSDCKMQEGSLRCDVNVSVRKIGETKLGVRTEMKNINSFRAVIRAINYESERQTKLLINGEKIKQETRRWNDEKGESVTLRSKEDSHDYRYFPEPDLLPMLIDDGFIENIKSTMVELPNIKKTRYIKEYHLTESDAEILSSDYDFAIFFERCITLTSNIKAVSNFLICDVLRILNAKNTSVKEIFFTPEKFVKIIELIDNGTISNTAGKRVLEILFEEDKDIETIIIEQNLIQISDDSKIRELIQTVIKENPKPVEDYKSGKDNAFVFLVGQIMRNSKGKANPQTVNALLKIVLNKIKKTEL